MSSTYCPVNIPGSPGAAGAAGAAGANGVNAMAVLTAALLMPAELANVVASVDSSAGFTIGQIVYVQFLGYFEVTAKPLSTQVTLKNLKNTAGNVYMTNSAPGILAPVASQISPAGLQGAAGSPAAAGAPTTAQYVLNVPHASLASAQALSILATGYVKVTTATGLLSSQAIPIPLTDGGTGVAAASAAALRLALGIAGRGVNSDITQLTGLTTALSLLQGGTGVSVANVPALRLALGLAESGANTNITSLTGLTTPLDPAYGGCGSASGFLEALYREETPNGVDAGAFVSGAWQTRALNTVSVAAAFGSLAANQVTLAAGTYIIEAEGPGYKVNNHQCRLQNITAGTTIALGTTARSAAADDCITISRLRYRFTLAGVTVVELQHRCVTTGAINGLGLASALGNPEVYSWARFTKVA